jgi:hypothetical protein
VSSTGDDGRAISGVRQPTASGLLAALLKVSLLLAGGVALAAQASVAASVIAGPVRPAWDGVQTWYQAERIRSGQPLYRALPGYGPHVMATGIEGFEPFSLRDSPHLPTPAAVVALAPRHALETFKAVWVVLLLLALWGFASALAVLAHGSWTLPRFLWWNGLILLTPYAHFTFQIGNIEPVLWLLFALAVLLPAHLATASLAISAAVKPYAAWPLAFSLVRSPRAWPGAAIAAAAVFAVLIVAMGPADLVRNARDWLAHVPAAMAQGTFHHHNVSVSFGVLRAAYWLGWWDYQPGPIQELWPRVWLTFAQVAGPLAAGMLTRRWDRPYHLSAVMLAALLFSPLCWGSYLAVALVPLAVWVSRRL